VGETRTVRKDGNESRNVGNTGIKNPVKRFSERRRSAFQGEEASGQVERDYLGTPL